MPVLVRYCNKCGIRIPPLDLEIGRAVEHHGVYYCAKCADDLMVVAEVVDEDEPPVEKKYQAPLRKQAGHTDKDKTHQRRAEEGRQDYRRPSSNLLPLYLLIIAVFVTLVVIVILVNRPNEEGDASRLPPPPPSDGGAFLPPETGRRTSGGLDAEEEQKLRKELDDIVKYAESGNEHLKMVIARLEEFMKKPKLPMSVASDAQIKLKNYVETHDRIGREVLEKAFKNSDSLVKELKFEEAIKVLDSFPDEYKNEDILRDLEKEKQRIVLEKKADANYRNIEISVKQDLKENNLEEARTVLQKWLGDFAGTVHTEQVKERLTFVEKQITQKKTARRDKIQRAYKEAVNAAKGLAENKKYSEAASVLRDFAAKHPGEKTLSAEARQSALAYEKLAQQVADVEEPKDVEPHFVVDFTSEKVASNLKYTTEASAVRSSEDGNNCLSMPAPEASFLSMEFDVQKIPERLVLVIEHAAAGRQRSKNTALIDIILNDKKFVKSYKVGDTFKIDPFDITRLIKKGINVLKISPARKSDSPYLLRRLGIAESVEEAFKMQKPFGEAGEPTGNAPGETKEPLFDGKSLKGWDIHGPAKWKVEDGIIIGTYDGNGTDTGFVLPAGRGSDKWLDYKLSFEVLSNVAGGWQVGLRTRKSTGGLVSGNLLNAAEAFEGNKWWKIELRIVGEKVYASVNGSDEFEQGEDEYLLPGTFSLGVKPGAVAKFKNVKFELLKSK